MARRQTRLSLTPANQVAALAMGERGWAERMLEHADLDDEARDTLECELADQARDRRDRAAYARGETIAGEPVDTDALWRLVDHRRRGDRRPPG